MPSGVSQPSSPHHHSLQTTRISRAACCFQIAYRTKCQTCGRPAGRPPTPHHWKPSILYHFFWSQKRAFFWLYFALKWSIFCHFIDTPQIWSKTDLFVVRMPRHFDFFGSFFRYILSFQIFLSWEVPLILISGILFCVAFCLPSFFCYHNSPSFWYMGSYFAVHSVSRDWQKVFVFETRYGTRSQFRGRFLRSVLFLPLPF